MVHVSREEDVLVLEPRVSALEDPDHVGRAGPRHHPLDRAVGHRDPVEPLRRPRRLRTQRCRVHAQRCLGGRVANLKEPGEAGRIRRVPRFECDRRLSGAGQSVLPLRVRPVGDDHQAKGARLDRGHRRPHVQRHTLRGRRRHER